MKKLYYFLISLLLIVSLSSCDKNTETEYPLTPSPTAAATATPTAAPTVSPTAAPTENADSEAAYIGNKNSKKFHRPDCHTLPAEKNRVPLVTKEEAIKRGYSPCQNCRP